MLDSPGITKIDLYGNSYGPIPETRPRVDGRRGRGEAVDLTTAAASFF